MAVRRTRLTNGPRARSSLAQLGRDHRKYGVVQSHYYSMHEALYTTLRAQLNDNWDDKLDDTARAALELFIGVMRGAADAEQGPLLRRHRRRAEPGIRDISVVRLQLDQPLAYFAGQYVTVAGTAVAPALALPRPRHAPRPQGGIEFHVRSVAGGMVSPTARHRTRPGDRWRLSNPHGGMQIDRGGGDVLMVAGSTGLAPLGRSSWTSPEGRQPAGTCVLRRAVPLRALRPAHAVADRIAQSPGSRCPRFRSSARSAVGGRLPRRAAAPRSSSAADRQAAGGGDEVRELGQQADLDLRSNMVTTTKDALIAKGAPPQTYPARSCRGLRWIRAMSGFVGGMATV